jgi:hypothetical protein
VAREQGTGGLDVGVTGDGRGSGEAFGRRGTSSDEAPRLVANRHERVRKRWGKVWTGEGEREELVWDLL